MLIRLHGAKPVQNPQLANNFIINGQKMFPVKGQFSGLSVIFSIEEKIFQYHPHKEICRDFRVDTIIYQLNDRPSTLGFSRPGFYMISDEFSYGREACQKVQIDFIDGNQEPFHPYRAGKYAYESHVPPRDADPYREGPYSALSFFVTMKPEAPLPRARRTV